jgi:hypothetical protein
MLAEMQQPEPDSQTYILYKAPKPKKPRVSEAFLA